MTTDDPDPRAVMALAHLLSAWLPGVKLHLHQNTSIHISDAYHSLSVNRHFCLNTEPYNVSFPSVLRNLFLFCASSSPFVARKTERHAAHQCSYSCIGRVRRSKYTHVRDLVAHLERGRSLLHRVHWTESTCELS